MIYTKEEFKIIWDSENDDDIITNDDIADCADAWGIYRNADWIKYNYEEVFYNVLEVANCRFKSRYE